MGTPETIVPAPGTIDAELFINAKTCDIVTVVPVAFAISGETATPIYYPAKPGKDWYKIERKDGSYSALGYTGPQPHDLARQVREGQK